MQNPTPVPTPAPAAPAASAAPATPVPAQPSLFDVNPQGQTRPLTSQEASIIREQRSEMSSQLNAAQGRREELLDELRSAPVGTEQGLRDQYQVLSNRIVAIETDIEASGRILRTGQVPASMTIVPPRSFAPSSPADNVERGAALGMTAMVVLIVVASWRRFRRRGNRGTRHVETTAEQDSRFERLEQAVDAIALEIERVGEAQRYQAKLLTEANMMPAMGGAQKVGEPVRARGFEDR